MNQKSIRNITIMGDKHLHNPMNSMQANASRSPCVAAGKLVENSTELSYRDELAMVVDWISGLPRQYLHFLIEELDIADTGHRSHSNTQQHDHRETLTDRENEVLTLVASGYSRAEIGNTLKISPNTAASHITNIYRKLDISSVADATKYAISEGILSI